MDVLDALTPVLRGRGMKRRTVAARAGMTEQRLSDTVHRRRRLTADELFALCRALEITPDTVYRAWLAENGGKENEAECRE